MQKAARKAEDTLNTPVKLFTWMTDNEAKCGHLLVVFPACRGCGFGRLAVF